MELVYRWKKGESDIKVISMLLPWIQWFHVYAVVHGVTIGNVVLVLVDIWLIIKSIQVYIKRKFTMRDISIIFLFVYFIVVLPIALLFSDKILPVSIMNRILKTVILYIPLISFVSQKICWSEYVKSLSKLTAIACVAVVIQFIMKLLTDSFFTFKIPFLHYANEGTDIALGTFSSYDRVTSIFTEPSHFVYFALQYLCIAMFGEKKLQVKTFCSVVFVTMCIVMTVSSTGIILSALLWLIFFFRISFMKRKTRVKYLVTFLILAVIVTGCIIIINNEYLFFAIFRLTNGYHNTKGVWYRIYSCFDEIVTMAFPTNLVGYGIGNIESEFMNSIAYILLCCGYFGVGVYVILFGIFLYKTDFCGKVAIGCLFCLSCIDMVLFAPVSMFYLLIAVKNKDRIK